MFEYTRLDRLKIPINARVDRILSPAYVSEMIGTFFLVLTVCLAVFSTESDETLKRTLRPLSIGVILMVMIFSTGGISGAHFNPAVTVTLHLTHPDKVPLKTAVRYIVSQTIGGMLAALLGRWIMSHSATLSPGENRTAFDAMSAEVFFALALCFVVLNVATTQQDVNNQYYGLAIGFTVASAAYAIGPVSGCALNPAVSFSVMMTHFFFTGEGLSYIVVYIGTPMIGAFFASSLFKLIRKAEFSLVESPYAQVTSENKPATASVITN
jgi:aquaporin Z